MSELKRVKFTEEVLYETKNAIVMLDIFAHSENCLLYTSPSPRDP